LLVKYGHGKPMEGGLKFLWSYRCDVSERNSRWKLEIRNKGMDGWIHHPQTWDVRTKYCSNRTADTSDMLDISQCKMSIKNVLHVKYPKLNVYLGFCWKACCNFEMLLFKCVQYLIQHPIFKNKSKFH
jgi:hypothetical protein